MKAIRWSKWSAELEKGNINMENERVKLRGKMNISFFRTEIDLSPMKGFKQILADMSFQY